MSLPPLIVELYPITPTCAFVPGQNLPFETRLRNIGTSPYIGDYTLSVFFTKSVLQYDETGGWIFNPNDPFKDDLIITASGANIPPGESVINGLGFNILQTCTQFGMVELRATLTEDVVRNVISNTVFSLTVSSPLLTVRKLV